MKKNNLLSDTWSWVAITILSVAMLIISCNKNNDDNNSDVAAAGVMAFNLAPDSRTIGFVANNQLLLGTPLVFNSYTGNYRAVAAGSQTFGSVNFTGGGALVSKTYNFEKDKFYSAFHVGNDPDYDVVIVNDAVESLTSATQSFIRYVNAIPDASNPMVTISAAGTNVVNETAAFKTVSSFTAINPGAVMITVSNGGTITATRTITLEAQKVYTILLTGKPGGAGDFGIQIKYVQNGTADGTMGRSSSGSVTDIL